MLNSIIICLRKSIASLFIFSFMLLYFTGCEGNLQKPPVKNGQGIFILNQGNFSWSNASLSLYFPDSFLVQNNIFYLMNDAPLGDVAQSMTLIGEDAFIVLNASHKIYVMDVESLEFKGKITNLNSPRYIQALNDTVAYVSDLYSNAISIFNPTNYSLVGEIQLGHSSEQMILVDSFLFVLSWSFDSLLFKINTANNEVIDSLEVGFQPNSMVLDKYNRLWILADGGYPGVPGGQQFASLSCIDPFKMELVFRLRFSELIHSPTQLQINGSLDRLYFLNHDIFSMSIEQFDLPVEPFIEAGNRNFYSLGVNPENEEIYLGDVLGYVQPGVAYRYDKHAQLIDSFFVGIIPGAFYFELNR